MYTIPIPAPEFNNEGPLQLAQIRHTTGELLVLYWRDETRQVVIRRGNGQWFIQPDASVTTSLAALLNCDPCNIIAKDITLFEDKPKMADAETVVAFYDCDWSDYAMDRICVQLDISVHYDCNSAAKQRLKVVRGIIQDEADYADMPDLIPV